VKLLPVAEQDFDYLQRDEIERMLELDMFCDRPSGARSLLCLDGHPPLREMDQPLQTSRPTTANGPPERTPPTRARLMFSLALGLADLTNERVQSVLAACSAVASPVTIEPAAAGAPVDLGHAALGFLTEAAGRLASAPAAAQRRWRRVSESARAAAGRLDRARKLAGGLPGVSQAIGRFRGWRDRGRDQLGRWAEVGRRQQAQSRVLAFDALTVLRENILARVSDSSDVKDVIREQSQGLAVTAMSELRERSARADALAERTVGRLFHNGRRSRTE
jgi:hypothetical protein